MQKLNIGCTVARHRRIGINAVVNARGGMQHLNDLTLEEIEMQRDANKIRDKRLSRVRFYQFNSRHFRKAKQVQHLLSHYDD